MVLALRFDSVGLELGLSVDSIVAGRGDGGHVWTVVVPHDDALLV